jgi:hypothetical protein
LWHSSSVVDYIACLPFLYLDVVSHMLDRIQDLFRGPDPTAGWKPSGARPLTLDWGTAAVNGIRPFAPYTELAGFGRPAHPRPLERLSFVYPEMGITFMVARERVAGADIEFQPHDVFGQPNEAGACDGFRPARLRLLAADGSELVVTPGTTPGEVRARLGEPESVDHNLGWLGLVYQQPRWEIEWKFGPEQALNSISLTYL